MFVLALKLDQRTPKKSSGHQTHCGPVMASTRYHLSSPRDTELEGVGSKRRMIEMPVYADHVGPRWFQRTREEDRRRGKLA